MAKKVLKSYKTMSKTCDTRSRNKLPKKLPYPFGVILL